jgi:hypothetical protein
MIATLTTSQSPSKKPCSRERKCGDGHAGMTGEGLHDEGTSERASERASKVGIDAAAAAFSQQHLHQH